ncbi:Hint domain-containing protein [Roseovarius sp. C7]|uniref:Hint domain-containing protein n=1 Tax=Roseovarius sp. C7 TaxID=3398643 RepID=UPI0039F6EDC1
MFVERVTAKDWPMEGTAGTPGRDTGDQEKAVIVATGLLADTQVATPMGWRAVEGLIAGDMVLTFDNGFREVTAVEEAPIWVGEGLAPEDHWLIEMPANTLGNRTTLRLPPQQGVMVESDAAELLYGDPFCVIPALALENLQGVNRLPVRAKTRCVTLRFAEEEVVFSREGGLLHCPSSRDLLELAGDRPQYEMLPLTLARDIVETLTPQEAHESEYCPVA